MTRLATAPIAAALESPGYRKTGSTFRRALDDVDRLVTVQKSASSSSGEIRATANIGVWIRSLAPVRAGVPTSRVFGSHIGGAGLANLCPRQLTAGGSVQGPDTGTLAHQRLATSEIISISADGSGRSSVRNRMLAVLT